MKQLQNAIGMRLALVVGGLSLSDLKREEGQTFVEYALVIGLISVAVAVAVVFFVDDITTGFSKIGSHLTNIT